MDSNQRSANFIVVTAHWAAHSLKFEKEPDEISATGGHRVLSPIDVNDVLYRLNHANTRLMFPAPSTALEEAYHPFPACVNVCAGSFFDYTPLTQNYMRDIYYLSFFDNLLTKGIIAMENEKIRQIKKAAGITAKVLNVLKIIAIVVIVLSIVSGIAAMIIKTDETTNTVRIGRLIFLSNVSDENSPVRKWLNITDPNVAAGLDAFIAAAIAAIMLAVVIILRKTFLEIEKSDTPFREEVLKKVRTVGILITVFTLCYSVGAGALAGLTAWCVYCIFDYGVELQKNEDETL